MYLGTFLYLQTQFAYLTNLFETNNAAALVLKPYLSFTLKESTANSNDSKQDPI